MQKSQKPLLCTFDNKLLKIRHITQNINFTKIQESHNHANNWFLYSRLLWHENVENVFLYECSELLNPSSLKSATLIPNRMNSHTENRALQLVPENMVKTISYQGWAFLIASLVFWPRIISFSKANTKIRQPPFGEGKLLFLNFPSWTSFK